MSEVFQFIIDKRRCRCKYVSVLSTIRTLDNLSYRPPRLLRAGRQSIDMSCVPGPQQQTCSSAFAVVSPCWDRQTDGHRTIAQTLLRKLCRRCQLFVDPLFKSRCLLLSWGAGSRYLYTAGTQRRQLSIDRRCCGAAVSRWDRLMGGHHRAYSVSNNCFSYTASSSLVISNRNSVTYGQTDGHRTFHPEKISHEHLTDLST